MLEVCDGAEYKGDAIGEDVVECLEGELAEGHDDANNHCPSEEIL